VNMNKIGILILGDESKIQEQLIGFILGNGFLIHHATEPIEAYTILEDNFINFVILFYEPGGKFNQSFFKSYKLKYPDLETIVVDDENNLSEPTSQKKNSITFLSSPYSSDDIQQIIESSLTFKKFTKHKEQLDLNFRHFSEEMKKKNGQAMVGISTAIKTISSLILLVSRSEDTSVIITGESGTGKELVARGIHALSRRNHGPRKRMESSPRGQVPGL